MSVNEAAFQKFQTVLQNQGVPPEEATWLANFWGELNDYLGTQIGLGAMTQGEEIRVFLFVPGKAEGISYGLGDLETMDNPIGEVGDEIRSRLMPK